MHADELKSPVAKCCPHWEVNPGTYTFMSKCMLLPELIPLVAGSLSLLDLYVVMLYKRQSLPRPGWGEGYLRMGYPLARTQWGTPPPPPPPSQGRNGVQLPWSGQVTLGEVMPRAVHILQFTAGGLSRLNLILGNTDERFQRPPPPPLGVQNQKFHFQNSPSLLWFIAFRKRVTTFYGQDDKG